jgi:ABC-2 type transport system ATP-binding protein
MVGLDPDDRRPYRKYALGMRQKLGIAQALMEKKPLLMLDEPMNNLDEESVQRVRGLLKQQHEEGTTLLITSHIREDIELLCQRMYHMRDGALTGGEAA